MIDWQLQLTFDNFFRFSIYRLSYSTLFMSTTVCSSACRRYEPLTVAATLSLFYCFQLLHVLAYIQWQPFTYTSKFLSITAVFVCLEHISSLGFAVVHFPFACAPYSLFFTGVVVAFLAFFTIVFKTFCCRFSVFQQFQYYLLYMYIVPTWYIPTSGRYITCTYTDNLYCSLIYCSNFLMV